MSRFPSTTSAAPALDSADLACDRVPRSCVRDARAASSPTGTTRVAFDYRGHGDARTPPEALDGSVTGTRYDWNHYGDDARVVATLLREEEGVPLVGFGHSMGGAGLILAAHRDPSLFRALVLYEPIVFPPDALRPSDAPNPLADGARRRRATFPSYEAAIENYAAKRPLSAFPREALEAYVRYGFREGEDGQVHLKCLPETEAGTFEGSGSHDAWDLLPEIRIPVLVLAGGRWNPTHRRPPSPNGSPSASRRAATRAFPTSTTSAR